MLTTLRRLSLGVFLIIGASAVLLLSDLNGRTRGPRAVPRIGVLQHVSTMLLDEGVHGVVDSLAESGFVDGKAMIIQRYNAEGYIALANSIAKQMVNVHFDLLMTASTLSLQTVANANPGGRTIQVFGVIADLLARFEEVRRADQLDETAAEMLRAVYI